MLLSLDSNAPAHVFSLIPVVLVVLVLVLDALGFLSPYYDFVLVLYCSHSCTQGHPDIYILYDCSRSRLKHTYKTPMSSPQRPSILPMPSLPTTEVRHFPSVVDNAAQIAIFNNATNFANELLGGTRVLSNGTRDAANMVIEHAARGHNLVATGTIESVSEAARFTSHARTRLEAYLQLQDNNDALLRERDHIRQGALVDGYGDYLSRLLRCIRSGLRRDVASVACPTDITNATTPHDLFTKGNWGKISELVDSQEPASMMWELDPSEDKGACPGKALMQYLTNVAWQFGQNSDPPLRGEQLELIVRSYGQRCQRARTDLLPLLKKRDREGLHNMLSAADGAIDGTFHRSAENDARAALHYAVKFSYDFYLTRRGSNVLPR